jgi:hypothetical protein
MEMSRQWEIAVQTAFQLRYELAIQIADENAFRVAHMGNVSPVGA